MICSITKITCQGKLLLIAVPVLFLLGLTSFISSNSPLELVNLKANHLKNPIGLEAAPLLSWQIQSKRNNTEQSAYQILVASSLKNLNDQQADLWNSGKVTDSQSVHIPYLGKQLASGDRAYWKIRIWDQDEEVSQYSAPAFWEMGLLNPSDWQGSWISAVEENDSLPPVLPAPYFRKEFEFDGQIQSARLYISGLGYYEAFINGSKIGDHVLDPGISRYDKRVMYVTYDISEQIKKGQNAIGVVLGNGWYNSHTSGAWDFDTAPWRASPTLLCQLVITDKDGSTHVVKTDETWTFANGPIIFNSLQNGETYDARKDLGPWHEAGYDKNKGLQQAEWKPVISINGPKGKMSPQLMPPIRVIGSIKPATQWTLNDSTLMIDLGQNMTGWANIKVQGPAGSQVKLRYGERIYEDGTLDQKELSRFIFTGNTQTDRYILNGKGQETYRPSFVYHGFQYIEVTSSHPDIILLDIQAEVVHSDIKKRGYFRSSNDMFNQLQENISWSFLGNYHGYPTDCPHREKIGWTGDASLIAETGLFNFDIIPSYLKWIDDFVDEQQSSGQIPGIIPSSGWGYNYGKVEPRNRGYGPQWEGALMEIPWRMYQFSGDTSVLDRYFPTFQRYVDYLSNHSKGHLLDFGIDDHKQLKLLTEKDYLSSAYYYYLTGLLSEIATITKRPNEAVHYRDLAVQVKAAFNERYYQKETNSYDHGGQTPLALALYFDLVKEGEKEKVLQELLRVIRQNDGHIDAGVIGTKAIINTLMKFGEGKVLYEMADKRTFPGWGYWIDELGATTMYQNWDGSQSRNHIMFGSIGDYFFKGLGGINVSNRNPGFKEVIISPSFDNDLTWVEAGHESLYGMIFFPLEKKREIRSQWK
jgi:alpha-L-rhamnosidase